MPLTCQLWQLACLSTPSPVWVRSGLVWEGGVEMVTREPDVLGGVLGKSGGGRRGQHQHRPRQSAAGARGANTGATTVSEGLTPTQPRCSTQSPAQSILGVSPVQQDLVTSLHFCSL